MESIMTLKDEDDGSAVLVSMTAEEEPLHVDHSAPAVEGVTDDNDEDFGDFVETAVPKETIGIESAVSPIASPMDNDDSDAFGDFESTELILRKDVEHAVDGDEKEPNQPATNEAAESNLDVSFGEFENANVDAVRGGDKQEHVNGTQTTTGSDKKELHQSQVDAHLDKESGGYVWTNGECGGFEGGEEQHASEGDEDAFGNFVVEGSGNGKGTGSSDHIQADAVTKDVFGVVDQHLKSQKCLEVKEDTAPVAEDEVDEFGDFDSHNVAFQDAVEDAGGEKDDDDDDDFGDFDSANNQIMEAAVPTSPGLQSSSDGSEALVIQRARVAFSSLFASQLPPNDGVLSGDEAATIEDVPLSSILASYVHERTEKGSKKCEVALEAFLHDQSLLQVTNTPQQTIVIDDGKGPFAHFSLPLGGRGSKGLVTRRSKKGSRRLTAPCLPDVLNIRLPSSEDQPVDMASPECIPRETVSVEAEGAVPPPSIAKDTTSDAPVTLGRVSDSSNNAPSLKGNQPSQTAQEFLKKIPDLSFMLYSGLSVPTNN